jgi:hypothetical protein
LRAKAAVLPQRSAIKAGEQVFPGEKNSRQFQGMDSLRASKNAAFVPGGRDAALLLRQAGMPDAAFLH